MEDEQLGEEMGAAEEAATTEEGPARWMRAAGEAAAEAGAFSTLRPTGGGRFDPSNLTTPTPQQNIVDASPRTIVVHAVQIVRHRNPKQTTSEEYLYLRPGEEDGITLAVVPGVTVTADISDVAVISDVTITPCTGTALKNKIQEITSKFEV